MTESGPAGFWSYAHADDALDGGAVVALASRVRSEYELITGDELSLFLDRDSIVWGDIWRQRIDAALSETTFFIAIITPRYFERLECRRELLEFVAKARSLGIEELFLPILYVNVEGLSSENSDEVMALVARTQYSDWRALRLLDTNSAPYRTAVNDLAIRLRNIARDVVDKQMRREWEASNSTDSDEVDREGISELVAQIEPLLPEWLEAVVGDKFNTAQIEAVARAWRSRRDKLTRAGAPASAIATADLRLGVELLPLLERFLRESEIYTKLSIRLDPLVSSLGRALAEYPEGSALAEPVRAAVAEAMEAIVRTASSAADPRTRLLSDTLRQRSRLSRTLQTCSSLSDRAEKLASQGNEIVSRWHRELPA